VINRRDLLIGASASIASAGIAGGAGIVGGWQLRQAAAKRATPFLDTNRAGGLLNRDDLDTVSALGETLAASNAIPPESFWHAYVNTMTMNRSGYLDLYIRVARLLNETATSLHGADFVKSSRNQRDSVLRELLMEFGKSDPRTRRLEAFMTSRIATSLRTLMMDPMLKHYYRSRYGWRVVGYQAYPGVPQPHPRAYTRPNIRS